MIQMEKTNPYYELVVNNAEKIEPLMTQMEQWSILNNILNYVQHSRFYVDEGFSFCLVTLFYPRLS